MSAVSKMGEGNVRFPTMTCVVEFHGSLPQRAAGKKRTGARKLVRASCLSYLSHLGPHLVESAAAEVHSSRFVNSSS